MSEDTISLYCCGNVQDIKINVREDDNMFEAVATKCGCKRDIGKFETGGFVDGKLNLKFVGVDDFKN